MDVERYIRAAVEEVRKDELDSKLIEDELFELMASSSPREAKLRRAVIGGLALICSLEHEKEQLRCRLAAEDQASFATIAELRAALKMARTCIAMEIEGWIDSHGDTEGLYMAKVLPAIDAALAAQEKV